MCKPSFLYFNLTLFNEDRQEATRSLSNVDIDDSESFPWNSLKSGICL